MINKNILYNLDDVAIMPCKTSQVKHRSECKVFYDNKMLPIFTAPMPCVVNKSTYNRYLNAHINPILPRTENIDDRLKLCKNNWCAFSLSEFKFYFVNNLLDNKNKYFVLIDIANGNMSILMDFIKIAKENYPEIKIMAGNIANPQTYLELSKMGADYVRLSVGSGTGCTSATNLGIFYPMASLIDECYKLKTEYGGAKIIADGGLSNFRNMIKSLALGADYIMLGSALNKCRDSAGDIIRDENGISKKLYYGMASSIGQSMLGKEEKAPEGKVIYNSITGTINDFEEDFISYLSSAMSYCGVVSLEDLKHKAELNVISYNSSKQFNQYQ